MFLTLLLGHSYMEITSEISPQPFCNFLCRLWLLSLLMMELQRDSSDGEEAEEEHPEEDPEYAEEEHPEKDAEHPVEDAEHPVEDAEASDSEKSSAMGTTLVLGGDDLAKMSDVETDPINEVPDLSPMSESAEPSDDDDDDDCGKANQDPLADTDNESRSPWEKTGYKDKKGRILALVARNPKNGNGPSSSNGSAGGGCRALCEDFFDGRVFCQGEGCVHCQKVFKITPPSNAQAILCGA